MEGKILSWLGMSILVLMWLFIIYIALEMWLYFRDRLR